MDQEETTQEAVHDEGAVSEETVAGSGSGEYDKGDYLARIKNDPDFAAEQVREKDRMITQVKEQLKKYSPLEAYVNAVGADELSTYIETGNSVLSNQQLRELVEAYARTGQLPTAQPAGQENDDDDPYEDPSVKELRAQNRSLEAKLRELESSYNQRFAQAETRSLQTGIEKNISKIMETYGVNDEVRERIASEINTRVQQGQKAAQKGDQQALNMLSMLAGDQGEETLTRIIAPVVLNPDTMRAIASAQETQRAKSLAAQSTGSPSTARTAGGEGEGPAVKYGPGFVRQALEKATKKAGRDPRHLWG